MKEDKNRVCPVELAGSLDTKFRRWLQNPNKILSPHIKEGMRVLDMGCGPGFFTIEIAKMVGDNGKVFAADLQEGMLQIVKNKIAGTELEKRITLVKCEKDKTNVTEKVDFVLCFYMVHEVPGKEDFFKELKNVLDAGGQILIIEPAFHVSKKDFGLTLNIARSIGLKTNAGPKTFMNRSAILSLND